MTSRASTRRLPRRPKRIALITGTRAEFGMIETILHALSEERRLDPKLIVTGMHLLKRFGHTIDTIRESGWHVDATVRMQTGKDVGGDEGHALGRGIDGIAKALDRLKCDSVLVLGDRIEAFAGASAACLSRRLLLHSHGGDRALGDVDDRLRDAITRMAHVHLAASRDAVDRLKRMGEEPRRIHNVGAPGLDAIRAFRQWLRTNRTEAEDRLAELVPGGVKAEYALVLHHPCGRSAVEEARVMRRVVQSVEKAGLSGVIIHPNTDPGHSGIVKAIGTHTRRKGWPSFPSLARPDYLLLAHHAALLIGNSSSGIIESAAIGVRAVNVGSRQQGRLRCGPSVVDTSENPQAIRSAIRKALRMPRPSPSKSVYGDGRSGTRIRKVLDRLIITDLLLRKTFTY